MLTDLILMNDEQINKFEIDFYLNEKNYPVVAALSALNTTNEIQNCYFKLKETCENGESALRLYALLQSMFVSIDSLYALAYSLTKSKSFININKNQNLRQLKYIRNDVVGHPANRMITASTIAYCILDDKKISDKSFVYYIYSNKGVEEVIVELEPLVESFYIESNNLLNELYNVAKENRKFNKLITLMIGVIDSYNMGGDYNERLQQLKQLYLKNYPHASAQQHRILWRLEHIEKLIDYPFEKLEEKEIAEYAIGLELIKLYQLVSGKMYDMSLSRRAPEWVSTFYRFLNKNNSARAYVEPIMDIQHPLFKTAMDELLRLSYQKGYQGVVEYLKFINRVYYLNEDDLLYGITLPLREYKKKK